MPSCISAGFPVTGMIVSDQTASFAAPLAAIIHALGGLKRSGRASASRFETYERDKPFYHHLSLL
jgi:hypothetical protein